MSEIKQTAPNAVVSLVLGICSIVFGCFFVGFVCGIVGLVLGNKGQRAYLANPDAYTNYGMLNAGRILSIIGIILGALYIFYYIVCVLIFGTAAVYGLGVLEAFS